MRPEQERVLREFLAPIFDDVVGTREEFDMPSDEEIDEALIDFAAEVEEELETESEIDGALAPEPVCDDESEL